ncbi:hypothetical protein Bbelb_320400 [Branchiostoma belcheri]|nr:hypothetical protein Bbelb_320400 [Branchiostoma belcheri]
MPPEDLETVYTTLIRPVLEYANVVYVGCNTKQNNTLEAVQRRAARILRQQYSNNPLLHPPGQTGNCSKNSTQANAACQPHFAFFDALRQTPEHTAVPEKWKPHLPDWSPKIERTGGIPWRIWLPDPQRPAINSSARNGTCSRKCIKPLRFPPRLPSLPTYPTLVQITKIQRKRRGKRYLDDTNMGEFLALQLVVVPAGRPRTASGTSPGGARCQVRLALRIGQPPCPLSAVSRRYGGAKPRQAAKNSDIFATPNSKTYTNSQTYPSTQTRETGANAIFVFPHKTSALGMYIPTRR